jgi:hypothetical protein
MKQLMDLRFLGAGIIMIVIAGGLYTFNFERESITILPEREQRNLFTYYAPEIDPFPHRLIVRVNTDKPVEVVTLIDEEIVATKTLERGVVRAVVKKGETLKVKIINPNQASGTVKTAFYCDSWNYSAAMFMIAATATIYYGYYKAKNEETLEEKY